MILEKTSENWQFGIFSALEVRRRRTRVVCVFSNFLNSISKQQIYIDWSNCVVTEPPLTMHIKDKDLKEMCKEKQFPALTFEEFPCHTQSVERCVKLISEAAMKVCDDTARYGYIRAQFQARKELPTLTTRDNIILTPNIQYA
ncbi:hypothetical protein AVEN_263789-1 [Araneus ventricosus]|uniref:Uncharacterized protein n=1 Tax=Araneus ventricosus TaxID=182803 RepID=A0A4Y2TXS2_ARAVE|nr:hypothetical protein AVEN_263789-1 [Araneus ventricosus]